MNRMEEKIRTFLAVDLPAGIKEGIDRIRERLKPQVKGVRWTAPDGIHLTLHFFGSVTGPEIAKITEIAKKNVEGAAPFMLNVGSLGTFPGLRRPRVLWLGINGETETLCALREEIEKDLGGAGFPLENRAFRPHLTLGRIRDAASVRGLEEAVSAGNHIAGSFTVNSISLFRSRLRPTGAVYTKIQDFEFGIS
ncbi:MAG: RNA 2',3'-cyclic phosphodiesterase [Syntrophales bacterium]|nr:RNA 2',3'-cyclic phosphodiesterase [Syntrophales bacterium]